MSIYYARYSKMRPEKFQLFAKKPTKHMSYGVVSFRATSYNEAKIKALFAILKKEV